MGISPLPAGFDPGQRFKSNPTAGPNANAELVRLFGNYQPNGHTGDDYPAPAGTPVYATEDGQVMWAGPGTGLPPGTTHDAYVAKWYLDPEHVGNLVAIEHDPRGGYTTLSYHLESIAPGLKPFDRVKRGQLIGRVGSTGRSTGPHLHLDVIPHTFPWGNGFWGRVDPEPYTNERSTSSMIFLTDLADQLRRRGLTVVEVPGWKTRGYAGLGFYGVRGVLHHHTATGRTAFASSNMPTLNLLTNGRSDLAGPLCNLGFGRDGTVYVIAAGWANHAGPGGAPGVPANQGNGWLIGVEAESSGVPPYDWTADQLRVWPHLGAAIEAAYLMALPASERLQLGHREYSSGGKIDPAGVNLDQLRASINTVLAGKTPPARIASAPAPTGKDWLDMDPKEARKMMREEIDAALNEMHKRAGGPTGSTSILQETRYRTSNDRKMIESLGRIESLLVKIAAAVAPRRIALSVWGYKGSGAPVADGGKVLDAYATLNGAHRQVHGGQTEQLGGSTVAGTTESEATK